MARNWLGELHDNGHSLAEIARETGFSRGKVKRLVNGAPLKKTDWNTVYNANRRVAREDLLAKGLSPRETHRIASHAFKPRQALTDGLRTVEKPLFQETYQFRIVGEFEDEKTKARRVSEGWSKIHHNPDKNSIALSLDTLRFGFNPEDFEEGEEPDIDDMVMEAIHHAQAQLGGSNWHLVRILDSQLVKYEMKPPKLG